MTTLTLILILQDPHNTQPDLGEIIEGNLRGKSPGEITGGSSPEGNHLLQLLQQSLLHPLCNKELWMCYFHPVLSSSSSSSTVGLVPVSVRRHLDQKFFQLCLSIAAWLSCLKLRLFKSV